MVAEKRVALPRDRVMMAHAGETSIVTFTTSGHTANLTRVPGIFHVKTEPPVCSAYRHQVAAIFPNTLLLPA